VALMRNAALTFLGWQTTDEEPGVLAFVNDVRDLRLVEPIAQEFERIGARAGFTVCRLDGRGAISLPPHVPGAANLFLSTLKVRAVLLAGEGCRLPRALASALAKRATPVAWLTLDESTTPPTGIVLDEVFYQRSQTVQEVARALLVLVGRERKWTGRRDLRLLRRIAATASQRMGEKRVPLWVRRLGRRIETIDDLRRRLGTPKTILCLGNGPSSEDRAVLSEAHDALFRTNHAWMSRGLLCHPHVVFTGLKETMRKISGPVFGLYGAETEKVLLMTRLARPLRKPAEYFVGDAIADPYREFHWGEHRPTSGAVMIATAVSLLPKRLVIAGVDMFASVSGAYPGNPAAANAYAPAHDRGKELAYILGCLDRHLGELEIYGDVLKSQVQKRRGGHI
jgi:hypothetical protein